MKRSETSLKAFHNPEVTYTANDFKEGDLIVNPFDKSQYLEIVEMLEPEDIPYCWCENLKTNTEGLQKWRIRFDEIETKADLFMEARRQKHMKHGIPFQP